MPRTIIILKNCIRHNIQDSLIQRLHFNDLYLLLMSLDIDDLKNTLDIKRRECLKKRGISEEKELSPEEAVKFLKGG